MEASKIISLLTNYKDIGTENLAEISALKKLYPWFATLHALEAKCLKNDNKFGLKKSIKSASLFAGNREHLYDLLHSNVELKKETVIDTEIDSTLPVFNDSLTDNADSLKEDKITTVDDVPIIESNKLPETTDKPETEDNEPNHEPLELVKEDLIEGTPTINDSRKTEVIEDVDKLDNDQAPSDQLMDEVQETNIEVDEVELIDSSPDEEKENEIEVEAFEPNEVTKTEITISVRTPENAPIEQDSKVDADSKSVKHEPVEIIYDPLVELQSKVAEGEDIDLPTKKPLVAYDPLVELAKLEKDNLEEKENDKLDFFSWLDNLEEDKPKETPKPRKLMMTEEASQLLENFIKNRPSISKIRKDVDRLDVYQPKDETPEFELVTESLAQLHLKQNRPEKALEIYQKLSLQNPEKFSYFAALIEKVKQANNLEE